MSSSIGRGRLVSVIVFLGACAELPEPDTLRSGTARDLDPQVDVEDFERQVRGNTDFGFDLFRSLETEHPNLIFSPHSLSSMLAMLYAGARGETETEMAEVLRFEPGDILHPAMNRLDLELTASVDRVDSESRLDLRVVNDVWLERSFSVVSEYLDVMGTHYGAGVRAVDFIGNADGARETINGWIASRTEDRVEDLFPAEAINQDTRLVLTNALYFKARWHHEFDRSRTKDGTFTNADGGAVTVPFMRGTFPLRSSSTAELTAVELPYVGEELALLLIMPSAARREAFEAGLNAAQLESLIPSMAEHKVILELPRFELQLPLQLDSTLKGLGLRKVYGDGSKADLTGIHESGDLQLATVVHEAFIVVDEEGTEAAAASGGSTFVVSLPPRLRFDRPFVFFLRHRSTGVVLFMGRVAQLPGTSST